MGNRSTPGLGIQYELSHNDQRRIGIVLGKDREEPFLPLQKGVMDHISLSWEERWIKYD